MNSTSPFDHQVQVSWTGSTSNSRCSSSAAGTADSRRLALGEAVLLFAVAVALDGCLLAVAASPPWPPSSAWPPSSWEASALCSASLTWVRHWTLVASAMAKQTARAAMPISAPFFGRRFPKNRMRKNEAAGMSGISHACSRNQPMPRQPFISARSSRSTLLRLR